jgi:DNA-binding PadR family transcriptional regulator
MNGPDRHQGEPAPDGEADELEIGRRDSESAVASGHDAAGAPVHRGWTPLGGRRRWMEPFALVLLAGGQRVYGYAITGQFDELGISGGPVNVGDVYRTLRDLEAAGLVSSSWSTDETGPRRRDYELTEAGHAALDEWAAVMRERARLIAEFEARYLEAVTRRPASRRAP